VAVDEADLGVAVDEEEEEAAAEEEDVDGECEDAADFDIVLIINLRCGSKARLMRKRCPAFGQQKHRVRRLQVRHIREVDIC
jgi:hypothetical protein